MSRHAQPRRPRWGLKSVAIAGASALIVFGSVVAPTSALASDTAEAEGRVLSGAGAINLNDIAGLNPAYRADPSATGTQNSTLDATVLDALNVDLGSGVQLFGPNGVVGVGALNQYANTTPTTSSAASGAVSSSGAIAVGGTGTQDNAFLDLTALLDNAGLGGLTTGLMSELRIELGALSATAAVDGGRAPTSDYQIADGTLVFTSPAVQTVTSSVSDVLGTLSTDVNAIAGADGTLGAALTGIGADLVTPLATALGTVTGGTVSVSNVSLTADLTVDLQTALAALTDAPLTSADSAVTIDFSTGEVSVDLAKLIADSQGGTFDGTLNNLAPNTELLSTDLIQAGLDGAIVSIFDQVPALLVTAATDTLNSSAMPLRLTADASLQLGLVTAPLADIDVLINGTVGSFLGTAGSTPPTFDTSATRALGVLPVGTLLTPIVATVTSTLLPAIVAPLSNAITGVGILETAFSPVLDVAAVAFAPLVGVLNQIVSLTANVQETPGEYTVAGADSTNSFTQRALSMTLLPALATPLAQVNLASATVRAQAAAIVDVSISSPTTGDTIVVPDGATDLPVSGVGEPNASVVVSAAGQVDQPATVAADGTFTVTFPGLAPGAFTATASQTVAGITSTDAATVTLVLQTDPAVIAGLTPVEGPETGSTPVVITGSGFTGATGVTFDGLTAPTFTVDSDTQVSVTTPVHAPGASDVVVLSPNGNSAPGAFEFTPVTEPAVVTGLSPVEGPETGSTPVVITGAGFTDATGVTFDGLTAPTFVVDSDTQISVTTPVHAPGATDVVVLSPNGNSAVGTFSAFEFTPVTDPAVVTGLSPVEGPETGATPVVITGTGFTDATGVTFDDASAPTFTVDSDTQISVTTPVHAPGATDVVVLSPNGNSAPAAFEFTPVTDPAVVTGLSMGVGPETGGTPVVISGRGFLRALGVTFGGVAASTFTIDSDTQISVTSPVHAPGLTDVVVLSSMGNSVPSTFTGFTFTPVTNPAVVTGLSPVAGPETGGTPVVITGTGFTGATAVTVGGVTAPAFVVDSDTQITITTPVHAPGATDVVVVSPNGNSAPVDFEFTNVTDPAVMTGMSPVQGPETGGTTVVITGSGFTGASGVTFSALNAASFAVDSDTQITVTTPVHTAGITDAVVLSPNGNSAPAAFEFTSVTAQAVVTGLTPAEGPQTGGTTVVIIGSGFTDASGVTFDGVDAPTFVIDSDTQITVTTPAHTPGAVDLIVTSPTGNSVVTVFTYTAVAGANGGSVGTDAAASASPGTNLANTGVNAGVGVLALLATLLGGALLLITRRRRGLFGM